jgi:hypothetical protein
VLVERVPTLIMRWKKCAPARPKAERVLRWLILSATVLIT